ncbi:MAG: hypothetical protein ABIP05_13205 [Nitrospiraceae bacterium]
MSPLFSPKRRESFTERRASPNEKGRQEKESCDEGLRVHPSSLQVFLSKVIRDQSEWVEGQ